ncbi:MAG TPA: Ig-like domain-containing protein, partial [Prolixibacteraceae bacterium]|nr:Ig-like domain-containing protein [Prolixibacteraceae bacterium]
MPQLLLLLPILLLTSNCRKDCCKEPEEEKPVAFNYRSLTVNGAFAGFDYRGVPVVPEVKIIFGTAVDPASVATAVSLTDKNSAVVPLTFSFANNDSTLVIQPSLPLKFISKYFLTVSTTLKSKSGGSLISPVSVNLATAIDSSHKLPVIPDDSLLTLIQKRTFRYFWDFGHPVSGMARERSTSGDIVTSGGTGFGIMSIPVAIERKFITRNEGLNRLQLMVSFLKNRAVSFHGAFPHWINGASGAVVPFSEKDNGADIVETSFLMMGLLTARQYFNGS